MMSALTGTRPLLRASLRHDGRRFIPWTLIAAGLSATSVLIYPSVFPDPADRRALSTAIGANPALSLVLGPARDVSTVDGFNAWRSLALGGFLIALGAIFTVTRATRAQEDSGQAELLASGVMGRSARLMSGILQAFTGSLAAGLFTGVITSLCGGNVAASMLLGATFTVTGWMFAAIAAVCAQLCSDARTANSLAVGTLGALFLLRGLCSSLDSPAWTLWINPLGWTLNTHPATGDHWMPLLLATALTAAVTPLAFALHNRRDFGQGLIAARSGPARGSTRTITQLVLRINRGPILTWAVAFTGLGLVFGYFATSVNDLFSSDSGIQQILAAGANDNDELTAAFLRTILNLVGIIATIPGIQMLLKVRTEELDARADPILAAAVPRARYLAANALTALATATSYILIAGTLVATLASHADIGVGFSDALLQTIVVIPATWTVIALSIAIVGARPTVSLASWAGAVVSFVLTLLGPTFGLDDWVLGISPFWHVPQTAIGAPDWTGLGWIALVTVGLTVVGFAGFRRRDVGK